MTGGRVDPWGVVSTPEPRAYLLERLGELQRAAGPELANP
jgi:hypothetical protein